MSLIAWTELVPACQRGNLSMAALYVRYVALGGLAPSGQLAAHLASGAPLSPLEHDVAVHAINERFLELDDPERLPYVCRGGPT